MFTMSRRLGTTQRIAQLPHRREFFEEYNSMSFLTNHLEPTKNMPTLTLEIVRKLLHDFSITANEFDAIDDPAAEALAKHQGDIYLDGLTSLSAEAAQALAKREGELSLDGLTSLSAEAAQALAKHEGWRLSLDGLTSLSAEAAQALAKHERELSLNGLTTLSAEAAQALAKHERELSLNGLTTLSAEAAQALAKHERELSLNGLRQFSEAAAEILSKHPSRVLRHREDGPAFTDENGDRDWWFDGGQYLTAGAWAEAVLKSRNEPRDAECVQQFLRNILCKEDQL
jgi:hypothetical protein